MGGLVNNMDCGQVSKEAKMRRVYQVLKEFNLEKRQNVKIGIPGIYDDFANE